MPLQSVSGRNEGEGRNNDFAAHSQGTDADFQRYRAVTNCDAIPNTKKSGDAPLQLLDEWTVIAQPPPIQQVVYPFNELCPVADVRPAYVERLRECRMPT